MSYVHNITLVCALSEDEREIRHVLDMHGFEEISQHYGGGKAAEILVFGAACNYLEETALASLINWVHVRKWEIPGAAVLVVNYPESRYHPTTVHRPAGHRLPSAKEIAMHLLVGEGSWYTRDASPKAEHPHFVVRHDGYRKIYPPRPYGELEAEYDFFRG